MTSAVSPGPIKRALLIDVTGLSSCEPGGCAIQDELQMADRALARRLVSGLHHAKAPPMTGMSV